MDLLDILKQTGVGTIFGIAPDSATTPPSPASTTAPVVPDLKQDLATPGPAPVPVPSLQDTLSAPVSRTAVNKDQLNQAFNKAEALKKQASAPLSPEQQKQDVTDRLGQQREIATTLKADAVNDPQYKQYASTIDKAQQAIQNAQSLVASNRSTAGWMGAMEKIGQALATYAAARYGKDKGVDVVGGMKLEPTDWDKIIAGSIQDMRDEITNLHHEKLHAQEGQEGILHNAQSEAEKQSAIATAEKSKQQDIVRGGLNSQADLAVKKGEDITNADIREQTMGNRINRPLEQEKKADLTTVNNELRQTDKTRDALSKIQGDLTSLDLKTLNRTGTAALKSRINQTLSGAGIDPASVQSETGMIFKSLDLDPASAKTAIDSRLKSLDQRKSALVNYRAALPRFSSPDEMDAHASQLGLRGNAPTNSAPPPSTGVTRMIRPDGAEVDVPADKVSAASAKGYKVK